MCFSLFLTSEVVPSDECNLPLPLFVARLAAADHPNDAFALDHSAVLAARLDRRMDFHCLLLTNVLRATPAKLLEY
jgi:hypothetical protein